ncbi:MULTISPECIES: rod shape-determining protein MreD [unclassified Haematospirillum]|uniref:rod shape-determining protein MreD n=1 Tax=unclassified Haematospirillum TaxID=2622088 RepID=UPI00143AFF1C|nr:MULTISPECIES: rod shape-determining protein MreD [unclassified Haematospirillum]NKD54830.1 rod shape-determining protein MreD [Haematospirillum sp. H4890]NKD74668.1 rod shape-determining protein MreD [Haematospirillum sp. H4485]
MQPSLLQRLDILARHQLPFFLCLALMLVEATPTHVPGFASISPMLTLVGIYYWGVQRPDITGYGTAFFVGLLEDILGATPLGVGSLTLMLSLMIVLTQERFFRNRSFIVTWWAFLVVAAFATVVRWALSGLAQGMVSDPPLALATFFMTVTFYPLVAWIFGRLQMAFLREV